MEKQNQQNITFQFTFLGGEMSGKTALIKKYIFNNIDDNYKPTNKAYYIIEDKKLNGQVIIRTIWDTPGQPRLSWLDQIYCKDSEAIFVTYSIDKRKSFDQAKQIIFE